MPERRRRSLRRRRVLARQLLSRAFDGAVAVLGGEAHEQLPGAATAREVGEHVRSTYETQIEFRSRRVLPELARLGSAGVLVGDGGGISSTSAVSKRASHAAASSTAVRTSTYVMPERRSSATLAATTVTSARGAPPRPRARAHPAGGAVADVAHGVDRLAHAACRHEDLEAVEVAAGAEGLLDAASSSGGSGSRRCPARRRSQRPVPARAAAPRSRSRARLAWVAECSYIAATVAGAEDDQFAGTRAPRRVESRFLACRRASWRACSPTRRSRKSIGTLDRLDATACARRRWCRRKAPLDGSGSTAVISTGAAGGARWEAAQNTDSAWTLGLDHANSVTRLMAAHQL